MTKRDPKHYKALYFDMRIQALKEWYPKKNHLGAYKNMKRYLLKHGFRHEQWSGYHSTQKMTDLEIFELVEDMASELQWFSKCVNHFAATNVESNYNLIEILEDVEI